MRRALGGTIYMAIGGLIGIATAVGSVDYMGAGQVRSGSNWQSFDIAAGGEASFYSNAHYLLGGRLPPAPGQMQEMTAGRDSSGALLDSLCSYVISGGSSEHVWWSFATATDNGVLPKVAGLLTSDDSVHGSDGTLKIVVAATPLPGNWVRTPPSRNFILIFTAAGESGLVRQEPLPDLAVTRGECT